MTSDLRPDAFRLRRRGRFGEPYLYVHECGSTQELLKRPALPEGAVAVAEHQTSGRGRLGRSWEDQAGDSLLCSVLLRPAGGVLPQLSLVAALATAEAVEQLVGRQAQVKWPNDVLLDGRKLGGILLETESIGDRLDAVIIGMGVNLASHPDGTAMPASDLLAATGKRIDPAECVEPLRAAFACWRMAWESSGFAAIREAWRARAVGRGEAVRVRLPTGDVGGLFEDIDAHGALLLMRHDGTRQRISAGDVLFQA